MNLRRPRLLVVSPHPDDWEIGAAGLAQRASAVHVVVASRGERGGDPATRAEEAQVAAAFLGATCEVLRHPDTRVAVADLAADLEARVRDFAPDVVLTTSPDDFHQDHAAAGRAAQLATRDLRGALLAYQTPSAERFEANVFVALDEEAMRRKVVAVGCHRSQAGRPYATPASFEAAGRYWALASRCPLPFAEPFQLLRHREA